MRRFMGLRWLTIGLIMLGALVNFLSRQTLSIAAPTVITNLHITTQQYGWITSAFQGGIMLQPVVGYVIDILGVLGPPGEKAAQLEHLLGDRAHGHLPWIEVGKLAAHGHQDEAGESAVLQQRKHVDAVPDPARLHQQRGTFAAERRAGDEAGAFRFAGQHDVGDLGILLAQHDESRMPGIRDITNLTDADALEMGVNAVRPGEFRLEPYVRRWRCAAIQSALPLQAEVRYSRVLKPAESAMVPK